MNKEQNVGTLYSPGAPVLSRPALLFVFRKPLARLVVPKSLSEEADKKTPFAIIRLRSANCNRKQKEDIQDGTE